MSVRWDDGGVRPVWPPLFGRLVLVLIETLIAVTLLLVLIVLDATSAAEVVRP